MEKPYSGQHQPGQQRPSLREDVIRVDRDILRMLVRRHNMLARMRNSKGKLDPVEEKQIRESWQEAVARVSHDPRLSSHFFALMQEAEFLPRPEDVRQASEAAADGQEGARPVLRPELRKDAFNLAPALKPVRLVMDAPQDSALSRAWAMLAAQSGQEVRLAPGLLNDAMLDFVSALNAHQPMPRAAREDGGVVVREGTPAQPQDAVLHMGDDLWNFYLFLGFYLTRPSRAKFSGDTRLKLADLTALRHFLPALGARLVHIVPRSNGFPLRVECSGLLPERISLPADVSIALAEGLLLAAPLCASPLCVDVTNHPERHVLGQRIIPLLRAAGVDVQEHDGVVQVNPGQPTVPVRPDLPLHGELATWLLALPLALTGEVSLKGRWPGWTGNDDAPDLLRALGLRLGMDEDTGSMVATAKSPLKRAVFPAMSPKLCNDVPLCTALAAVAALHGGEACLPAPALDERDNVEGFLRAAGLSMDEQGNVGHLDDTARSTWNAPDARWALALALASCARPAGTPGFLLGNPSIITGIWPAFWGMFNALPEPHLSAAGKAGQEPPQPKRRRVRTQATAELPDPPEQD